MATSELDIINSALAWCGAEPINSLADTTKAGKIASREYSKFRDRLLIAHTWNFATERAELAADGTFDSDASFDWDYRFQLPANCLRVYKTDLPSDNDWAVEGSRFLYCNSDTIKIKYIKRVTDVGYFTPSFEDALSFRMASMFATALQQDKVLSKDLWDRHIQVLKEAKAFDGQEGSVTVIEANEWLNSRR